MKDIIIKQKDGNDIAAKLSTLQMSTWFSMTQDDRDVIITGVISDTNSLHLVAVTVQSITVQEGQCSDSNSFTARSGSTFASVKLRYSTTCNMSNRFYFESFRVNS